MERAQTDVGISVHETCSFKLCLSSLGVIYLDSPSFDQTTTTLLSHGLMSISGHSSIVLRLITLFGSVAFLGLDLLLLKIHKPAGLLYTMFMTNF